MSHKLRQVQNPEHDVAEFYPGIYMNNIIDTVPTDAGHWKSSIK